MPSRGSDEHALKESPQALAHLREARALEQSGQLTEAVGGYELTIAEAEKNHSPAILSVALRRLAVLRHHRDDVDRARVLCRRSRQVADAIGNRILAAEALNTEGGLDLTSGALEPAREAFLQVLEIAGGNRRLRARAEQNLGIVASIQGRLYEALTRYERSLAAYRDAGDEHGCAIAYHNLGRVAADRGQADAAETYYNECLARAERCGDVYLQGLTLVSQADLDVARQRFENARQRADGALALFGRIGARGAQSAAHRVLGMVYRETGRLPQAEEQLRTAIELAVGASSALDEAECSRELARVYQLMGRNQEALLLLNTAYRLFRRLDARTEMGNVHAKVNALESSYLSVMRSWARAIEAADSNAPGHCERVARNALLAARHLGLDEHQQTTIMLGSYLHDLGMIRVPRSLLHKAGALAPAERQTLRRHTLWGLELFGSVELPWDVKPIIRWHHERCDGSGYPDRLAGDQIPVTAQLVGIFDTFDAMIHPRPYQPRVSPEEAVYQLTVKKHQWSPAVFGAFTHVVMDQITPGVPVH